jgi:hypothetical protein
MALSSRQKRETAKVLDLHFGLRESRPMPHHAPYAAIVDMGVRLETVRACLAAHA